MRKKRKYIGLLAIGGSPPLPRIGNFSSAIFFLFRKPENDNLYARKHILYDTATQTMDNRAVHSKERREKGLCMKIWIRPQHNEVYHIAH